MDEKILNTLFKPAMAEEPVTPPQDDADCGFFNYTGRQDASPFKEDYEELDSELYESIEACRMHLQEAIDYTENEDHLYTRAQRTRIQEILNVIAPLCDELDDITANYEDS